MATNKVVYGDRTLIDLTSDSVTPSSLLEGETAHDRSGAQITGTLGDFTGATSSTAGTHGLVPAPAAGDQDKVLKGNGTWGDASAADEIDYDDYEELTPEEQADGTIRFIPDYPDEDDSQGTPVYDFTGATSSANGHHGLVPAPLSGDQDKVLKGNGTWGEAGLNLTAIVNAIYPVGSILMSADNTNPSQRFAGTTWIAWGSGQVPVGVNASDTDFNTVEKTGGAKSQSYTPSGSVSQPTFTGTAASLEHSGGIVYGHSLTVAEMAKHNHYLHKTDNNSTLNVMAGTSPSGLLAVKVDNTSRSFTGLFDVYDGANAQWINSTDQAGNGDAHSHNFKQPTAHSYTPSGSVSQPSFTGSSANINSLQPYITCYMWKRTA